MKFVNYMIELAQQNKWMTAGADAEIAKISAATLAKTEAGRRMMEKVNAMSAKEVDDGLRGLEPRGL